MYHKDEPIVLVIPKEQEVPECIKNEKTILHTWYGNQSRFFRIKYAFMLAVLQHFIQPDSKVACEAIAVVVSESTGRVKIFNEGKFISALDPVISTRVV